MDIIIAILAIMGLVLLSGALGHGVKSAFRSLFKGDPDSVPIRLKNMRNRSGSVRVTEAWYHKTYKRYGAYVAGKSGKEKWTSAESLPQLEEQVTRLFEELV